VLNLSAITQFLPIKFRKSASKKSTIPDSNLVPYSGFYNPSTIITKNGELMKIIRIVGLGNDSVISNIISLRESIRMAVADYASDGSFAFWFTTIRRKKNINPGDDFNDFFSKELNDLWVQDNNLNDHFVNELYISVLVENAVAHRSTASAFASSFLPNTTKFFYESSLADSYQKLSEVVKNIMFSVDDYGAKLLGIVEFEGIYYSEALSFLGKLSGLHEETYPLTPCDISETLTTNNIFFGDQEVEVVGDGFKRFAAIFSLKDYFELNFVALDKILQLPFEFTITQSFDFSSTKKDLVEIEFQDRMNKVSGDEDFREISGINDFFVEEEEKDKDSRRFGKLQTMVTIISSTRDELNSDIKQFCEKFQKLGMVFIREDVFLEHCFWSQMPGNFNFLRRQKNAVVSKIAGFSSLQSFPAGQITNNPWGPAVCVLKTIINTPYFFNFHGKNGAVCLIIGKEGSGRTVLVNFLIAQARRFKSKIFYIDFDQKARCFILALNGSYFDLSCQDPENPEFLNFCPFSNGAIKDSDTEQFLNNFLRKLAVLSRQDLSKDLFSDFSQEVRKIIGEKPSSFSELFDQLKSSKNPEISALCGDILNLIEDSGSAEKPALKRRFFDNYEKVNWQEELIGFNLSHAREKPNLLAAILYYLAFFIENQTKNEPTILVIKEAELLIESLGDEFNNFVERLKSKNCVLVLIAKDNEKFAQHPTTKFLVEQISLLLLMSNPEAQSYHQEIFQLSDDELLVLKETNPKLYHFLLKRDSDIVISSLNFKTIKDLERVLSSDTETLMVFNEIISHTKNETYGKVAPEVWVPMFFDLLEKLRDERNQAMKELVRQENISKRRSRSRDE